MKPEIIKANITQFEAELSAVQRPGIDRLLDYIRKSDFYRAPASTKFHLCCEGGLLQHSLNVGRALRGYDKQGGVLTPDGSGGWDYVVAGRALVRKIPDETVTILADGHDICKAHFYGVATRNVKNETTGKWEKVPFYTVDDRMPLGHGPKSAMILKEYIKLTNQEMYAIWHHMGFAGLDPVGITTLNKAIELYPIIWALHTADMMASAFMEGEQENKPAYLPPAPDPEDAPPPATDEDAPPEAGPVFHEAPPLS